MRRRDPFKAEREEAFRAGLSGDWRKSRPADLVDDDWEPVLYTQSQLDAAGVRIGAVVSVVWAVICAIVVYVALTGGH
jgi:hypothetical protein